MNSTRSVTESVSVRTVFVASVAVSVAVLWWIYELRLGGDLHGLSPIYFTLFVVYDRAGAGASLLTLVLAFIVSSQFPFRSPLRWLGDHPILVAAAGTILMSVGALVVYRNHPLAMDEYAPFFQSRVFAAGHLAGRFPPPLIDWLIPEVFQNYFLKVSPVTGRVASAFWPSFALLLTPFTWLGIAWMCNPIISGLTIIAIHRLALHLFNNRESAGLVVLLTVASPVFSVNGISYYSMPAHLLASTVYALLLMNPTPARGFLAGIVGSVALTLHNPVPHMLFAAPWLLWIAVGKRWRTLACAAAGYLPLCVLLGLGWVWFSNNLPHEGLTAAADSIGKVAVGMSGVFRRPSATILLARLIGLVKVSLWAVPSMLLLAGIGGWKRRHDPRCRLFVGSALATFVGYLFVPVDQGHGWGFRYFHSAWLVIPLLVAAVFVPPVGADDAAAADAAQIGAANRLRSFVVACALITLVTGVPLRAEQVRQFVAMCLNQVPAYSASEPEIVLIKVDRSFYAQDLVQNDPFLRNATVTMISHGAAADAAMMSVQFPDYRRVYSDDHGEVWSRSPSGTY
jgi:hypothetical protein